MQWSLTEQLLAAVVDTLAVMSWQLSGNPKAPRPHRIPRPGVPDTVRRHGKATRPRAEIVAYLRRFGPPPTEEVTTDG